MIAADQAYRVTEDLAFWVSTVVLFIICAAYIAAAVTFWLRFKWSDAFFRQKRLMKPDIERFNQAAAEHDELFQLQQKSAVVRKHDCSLNVVNGSMNNQVKYILKYFHYDGPDELLCMCEQYEDRLADIVSLRRELKETYRSIYKAMPYPAFRWFLKGVMLKAFGVTGSLRFVRKDLPYGCFLFSYVSPAGRSRRSNRIELNAYVLDSMIEELREMTSRKNHAKRERARMTKELREMVLRRDGYTCRQCGASRRNEPNLLLEVDHIVPVSKGGKTELDNLQTLCWKCNRTKSDKM